MHEQLPVRVKGGRAASTTAAGRKARCRGKLRELSSSSNTILSLQVPILVLYTIFRYCYICTMHLTILYSLHR